MTAFLSFVVAIPPASAKCINDFPHVLTTSQIPAAATAAAESLSDTNAEAEIAAGGIVGLWNVTFTSGGQTVDVVFDAWHGDDTEILNNYTNPIEDNVCLGVWAETGRRTSN